MCARLELISADMFIAVCVEGVIGETLSGELF